jgi:hypothetical protein
MTCPQILDAGNNLFDTGAVNMLNKQLLAIDSLGVGHRAQNYVPQIKCMLRNVTKGIRLGEILWHALST